MNGVCSPDKWYTAVANVTDTILLDFLIPLQRDPGHFEEYEVVEFLLEKRLVFACDILPCSCLLALTL